MQSSRFFLILAGVTLPRNPSFAWRGPIEEAIRPFRQRVIVVTNKAHTRRVHILWNKSFVARGQSLTHGIPDDDFVADLWNAWAGLPVRPSSHPAHAVVPAGSAAPEHTSAD
jgi:hypothetical protein